MSISSNGNGAVTLAVVVPCFNEEQVLHVTVPKLLDMLAQLQQSNRIGGDSFIVLVDDGSTDKTWQQILDLSDAGIPISGIKLTRNFGHQYALYAGLMETDADCFISMDADLQDDISVVPQMLQEYECGNEVVYAVRSDRSSDTRFKRWTANLHYRLSELMGIETVRGHADFRFMSRRAVNLLRQYRETNLYLRGAIPQLGLRSAMVYCKRDERVAGESKYTFWKMLSLSIRGLTSFSVVPLRFIALMGILIFIAALGLGGWVFYAVVGTGETIPGWASTVLPMYLLGGFQLFAIGVLGEYIGKIYMEVKRRPLYLLEDHFLAKPR